MSIQTLLITPPFSQLNTPYPATAYLKGFLDEKGVLVSQCDLSIELFSKVFTTDFIRKVFFQADNHKSYEYPLVWEQREEYIHKVEMVIKYLQHQEVTQAYQVLHNGFLPKGHRALNIEEDLSWAFGNLGILDKAKHLATIFIEELGDFIQANVDEFFSFTRYAEQIATSATNFNSLEEFLQYDPTIIEEELLKLLDSTLKLHKPKLICFSIPFPGNLFAALRCAQFTKSNYPEIKIAFGGGYCNTELRSLEDPRIFKYIDFISLDDGEAPMLRITEFIEGKIDVESLERTYVLENARVVYKNKLPNTIFHHKNLPAPSYEGLPHDKYLSFLDVMNPMHRLWSDGKWNKLTVSHGCYWKQCSFCDVTLDYIGNYQNTTADDLVEKNSKNCKRNRYNRFPFCRRGSTSKNAKGTRGKAY
jgi:hypothetical protein